MTPPISAFDTHVLWQTALGMGAVVLVVVVILLMLLLSYVKDIQGSVGVLLEVAPILAQQTSKLPLLRATPGVLDLIIEEALVQNGYMDVLVAHHAAPGETP